MIKICMFVKQIACFKVKYSRVNKSIGLEAPRQLIVKSVAKFVHSITITNQSCFSNLIFIDIFLYLLILP